MPTPASPLFRTLFPTTMLLYDAVPGNGANMPTPAPPLLSLTLWTMMLLYTPPMLGSATAAPLCDGSVIPQSSALLLVVLSAITLKRLGPNSSVIRIPPTLCSMSFPKTLELVTLIRCSASPQSPGISPDGAHSGVTVVFTPVSLWVRVLWRTVTFDVDTRRMPSPMAFSTLKPEIEVPDASAPDTTIPLIFPVASIVTCPAASSETCFVIVTCSAYVPPRTSTRAPPGAIETAWLIVRQGAPPVQSFASLPFAATCNTPPLFAACPLPCGPAATAAPPLPVTAAAAANITTTATAMNIRIVFGIALSFVPHISLMQARRARSRR